MFILTIFFLLNINQAKTIQHMKHATIIKYKISENQNQWQAEKRLLFNAHILIQVNLKKLACSPSKIITIY